MLGLMFAVVLGATTAGPVRAAAPAPKGADDSGLPTADEVYDTGKALFDEFAPPEVKQQYEFPSRAQWDQFADRLQRALNGDSLDALAAYEPEAESALAALRTIPGYADYADWLNERLDLIRAARQATRPPVPAPEIPPGPASTMPYYTLWRDRLRHRPEPPGAAAMMPKLEAAFAAEGVPADLAWMAEVESGLNPQARSPAGARGLFQLMPATARAVGLRTALPDERTDPERSAQAAARLLRRYHDRFGDWPLALAAYNAGENRVARVLAARHARTFAEIARDLPVETRLYVPKVYATIARREGGGRG